VAPVKDTYSAQPSERERGIVTEVGMQTPSSRIDLLTMSMQWVLIHAKTIITGMQVFDMSSQVNFRLMAECNISVSRLTKLGKTEDGGPTPKCLKFFT